MAHMITILAMAWTLAWTCAVAAEPPSTQSGRPQATASSTTQPVDTHGMALRVRADRSVIRSGEPLVVILTVQNRGNVPAKVESCTYGIAWNISVFRSGGTLAPPTYFQLHTLNNLSSIVHFVPREIPPGMQASYRSPLTACFDLTEPGDYVIRASARAYMPATHLTIPLLAETSVEVRLPPASIYDVPEPIPEQSQKGE